MIKYLIKTLSQLLCRHKYMSVTNEPAVYTCPSDTSSVDPRVLIIDLIKCAKCGYSKPRIRITHLSELKEAYYKTFKANPYPIFLNNSNTLKH